MALSWEQLNDDDRNYWFINNFGISFPVSRMHFLKIVMPKLEQKGMLDRFFDKMFHYAVNRSSMTVLDTDIYQELVYDTIMGEAGSND